MQVCHVIILLQEGSRFDTQMLKKFRVLQTAKQAMAPYIRSLNTSLITTRPRSSAYSPVPASGESPKNRSPGKSRGILNRNASITVMSGLGSYSSLLPGQCTPVVLFVFVDDFIESHHTEEPSETSVNFSSSLNSSARSGQPIKGSGSVVVLARPVNKFEGGLRKKLQSSLEAQIRFSIKKCRTLSTFESSSRNGAIVNSAPLFSLDASKAVSLVDFWSSQSGESLEFAIDLVEEILNGKATSDSLLLESHHKNSSKEDILSVKEFIYRQCDILRGKGSLVASSNSGVGMVAVAAAAAAASTGKRVTTPELPTFEFWSSSCQLILQGILSAKCECTYEAEISKTETTTSDPLQSAVSHLRNGIGLTAKFSTLWCEKAFPIAKDVYLDDLPPCYPSSQHDDHLKKALRALTSMVKGPAVQLYMKKLKDECTSIWTSGRQLCDAVSLTGKPCMHQRHDISEPHSSGFVYLHACACGRSRRLRPDPFDYETANFAYNIFADCDKLLPAVKLPEGSINGPIQPSSWNLVRVGGARYYDPSKGLLQSGFYATQKFLLKWTIFQEKVKEANHLLLNDSDKVSLDRNIRVENVVDAVTQNGVGTQSSSDITGSSSKNISVGKVLSNFTMRKAFSEVVSGAAAANSGFPPLFPRKQPASDADNGVKLHRTRNKGVEKVGEIIYNQESQKVENITSIDKALNDNGVAGDAYKYGISFPRVRSSVEPLSMNGGGQIKAANSMKHVSVYVGFEHECPRGHRFILSLDHLNELGSSYAVPEENVVPLSVENSGKRQDLAKLGKTGGHGRTRRQSHGIIMVGGSGKNLQKSKEKVANGNMYSNKPIQSNRQGKEQNERTKVAASAKDLDFDDLKATSIDDGGCAFSLLNRSLPIYMNCPHCRGSITKNDTSDVKFPSTVSQLQRIFVVTPSFPILLAADPIIQFEVSCLPPSFPDREKKLRFSLGCPVILPPESFLSLKLPFVYGVELEDGSLHSLKPFENQPQLTAYIMKGTTLKVASDRSNLDPGLVT
ncbi:hypothetical protein BUALT_BualtUnG0052700 [Buddleja alternifolia]|uniref:Nonsense-mediated mRNA decay factor SMG8 n=1 Tax=Buddleja alternifolia TaxID=168488 RepID=A0AAV6VZX4_9LAMI|nr:hypothetical protein BUALT_BualtUnG0052700 [Buddleja alternifolia]